MDGRLVHCPLFSEHCGSTIFSYNLQHIISKAKSTHLSYPREVNVVKCCVTAELEQKCLLSVAQFCRETEETTIRSWFFKFLQKNFYQSLLKRLKVSTVDAQAHLLG